MSTFLSQMRPGCALYLVGRFGGPEVTYSMCHKVVCSRYDITVSTRQSTGLGDLEFGRDYLGTPAVTINATFASEGYTGPSGPFEELAERALTGRPFDDQARELASAVLLGHDYAVWPLIDSILESRDRT